MALCPLLNALSSVTDQTQTSDSAARACDRWALPLKSHLKAASPPLVAQFAFQPSSIQRAKSIVPKNFRASSRRVEFWHSAPTARYPSLSHACCTVYPRMLRVCARWIVDCSQTCPLQRRDVSHNTSKMPCLVKKSSTVYDSSVQRVSFIFSRSRHPS